LEFFRRKEALELRKIIQLGESSKDQFKVRVSNANAIGAASIDFSNVKGGLLNLYFYRNCRN
jgi:hypothetical protein